ncbi:hypothetical protein [Streptomyces bungoensis]|uniref:hypothetical protein n=1 Tax=Streptomyces bungoensis TaxID=285568 RepID=UPI003434CB7F
MSAPIPRLFVLRRDHDVTGVSGPGDVADGVQWPDGSVVLRWRERPSTSVWDSLDLMLSVHGHDGATRAVWAEDEAQARQDFVESNMKAYDVPAALLGTEAERAHVGRQLAKALGEAHSRRDVVMEAFQPDRHAAALADAVMPIVTQLLEQRDRAQRAAGRAYKLADRWEAAHGSSVFLVRAAGAELRDGLDGDLQMAVSWPQLSAHSAPQL